MPVIQPAIRPPAEADSFLLQVTTGCSSNSCSFCGAYRDKRFAVKSMEEIRADIAEAAPFARTIRRVFLMDGDALVLDNNKLLPILRMLHTAFPKLTRIASYANDYNIINRSDSELHELHDNKLRLIYMGLESGSQRVLDRCNKKSSVEGMIRAVNRCTEAGIKSSVIVLIGLGGTDLTKEHITETAEALNRMQPRLLSFLSLMLIPGTELHRQHQNGDFILPDTEGLLREALGILSLLDLKQTVFRSNHASNHLPLEGRLPADKERLCSVLEEAIKGNHNLRAESSRGL